MKRMHEISIKKISQEYIDYIDGLKVTLADVLTWDNAEILELTNKVSDELTIFRKWNKVYSYKAVDNAGISTLKVIYTYVEYSSESWTQFDEAYQLVLQFERDSENLFDVHVHTNEV